MTQYNQKLFDSEDYDGRFANEWVFCYSICNLLLLVDLILAVVFYGPITLYRARSEFVWEAFVQLAFLGTIGYYLSLDLDQIKHQI